MTHEELIGLLAEAESRIQDIVDAARDHEELGEDLANRIEDAGALATDIAEALTKEGA